jgi:hypothetical protein
VAKVFFVPLAQIPRGINSRAAAITSAKPKKTGPIWVRRGGEFKNNQLAKPTTY